MTIPLSETPTVGIGQFIKEVRFQVPSHQRDYSWKEEYVRQFIDDIQGAMENQEQIYFCGLMVFTKTEAPAFNVLDGQQRLATTLMILGAIRNWLGSYTNYSRAKTQIEERYIGDSDLGKDAIEAKLILNAANNDTFRKFVIDAAPLPDIEKALKGCKKEDRNRALLEAIVYVNKRIRDIAGRFSDTDLARDYLLSMVTYITTTVQIVRLVVRGDEAAYTIFETLNDRGMELSPLDLVKNYLFSRAEKEKGRTLRDMEERWTEMMTLLSTVKADSFLRAFWASRHGVLEGTKLFAAFKRVYSAPSAAYDVSVDLRSTAENYVALSDAGDAVWASHSLAARKSVAGLAILGSTQMHPIMLAALEKFETREIERLFRLLEVIAVRYQLVARGRPGRIESLGGRTAKQIYDGKLITATAVFSELRELYTTDDVFRSEFSLKTERESKKAAYLLRGLEHQALLQQQDIHHRETTPDAVTIEHVLPKNPGDGWVAALEGDPEFHSEYLYRIGNLCLLSDANRTLGNKSFEEKKAILATSKLITTRSISEYAKWDRSSIDRRQRWLADLAVAQWRFQ